MAIPLGKNTEIKVKLGGLVILIGAAISVAIWVTRVEAKDQRLDERMTAMEKRWDDMDEKIDKSNKKVEQQNDEVLKQVRLIGRELGVIEQ